MDFARKQLEKYGWTDGKGLGKHENGISEALKPKIKRSVAGVGHDPAAEFNEHWWTALYDKAAGNVEVQDKNGKTKKIKTKDDNGVIITTSTWKLNRKQKDGNTEQYSENFVRTAVLTSGGSKVENVKSSDSESEDENRDVFKMTDEELFAACEGRTAHKGARHGLKATGKLARIAQQEALLLQQARFNGYSHAKKIHNKDIQDSNLDNEIDSSTTKLKKKKRKCNSNENLEKVEEIDVNKLAESKIPPLSEVTVDDSVARDKKSKKSKSKKRDLVEIEEIECSTKQKKKKHKVKDANEMETTCSDEAIVSETKVKKKKKKNSDP